jgi:hypothetical protein
MGFVLLPLTRSTTVNWVEYNEHGCLGSVASRGALSQLTHVGRAVVCSREESFAKVDLHAVIPLDPKKQEKKN